VSPLAKGASKAVIAKNIAEMKRAGHPTDQSVAAAYRQARASGAKLPKAKKG